MRQNPRVEPPTQPTIALHSVLSSALANLDIQLEDELARYRRQRLGGGRTAQKPGRKRSTEALDLITVPAIAAGRNTAASEPVPVERLAGVAGAPNAPDAYKPIPAFTASPQPFEGAIALRATQPPSHDNNADESHTLAPATPNLDDYLESSEELLRSLADEQAEVQAERNFVQSLLTPLGLGSMLLLLLSSAMFGYVIMNPSSLPWLTAKSTDQTATSPSATSPGQGVAPAPQPDPAKRELPDLNLNNLGTVNVNPGTAPSTAPATQAAPTPSSKPTIAATTVSPVGSQSSNESAAPPAASTQAAPSSRPYATTNVPQAAPRRAPIEAAPVIPVRRAPASPAPTARSQSSGGSAGSYDYKVGIPFENDQTLENARKVVPDAFVRTLPDGRTIVQAGAGTSKTDADKLVQQLRDQGLSSTEVYKR